MSITSCWRGWILCTCEEREPIWSQHHDRYCLIFYLHVDAPLNCRSVRLFLSTTQLFRKRG